MNLTHITLTGAGVDTPLADLKALSAEYPLAEWGLLYSPNRAGTESRYPPQDWIRYAARELRAEGCRVSIHLCGSAVEEFVSTPAGEMAALAGLVDRIQLNLPKELSSSVQAVHQAIARFPAPVITQQNAQNSDLNQAVIAPNHRILFDASGGRGIQATEWPQYWAHKVHCGYAGGLSPENIQTELPRIAASAGDLPFWIDCEGRIRDEHDQLSIPRCREMLRLATGVAYAAFYTRV